MSKSSSIESENVDRFIRVMARVLGVSRHKFGKIMFHGLERPRLKRRSLAMRDSPPSKRVGR